MPTRLRIMVFGDSICAGCDAVGVDQAHAWPTLMGAAGGYAIINRSRGGRPTDSFSEFSEAWAAVLAESAGIPPDAVLIALGTNDSRDLDPGMVGRAVANIDAMVRHATAGGARRFIIAGPYNINQDALQQTHPIRVERDRNLRQLGEAYAAYAAQHGLGFLPLYGSAPPGSMVVDGVHPDRAGNVAIAAYVQPRLPGLLQ